MWKTISQKGLKLFIGKMKIEVHNFRQMRALVEQLLIYTTIAGCSLGDEIASNGSLCEVIYFTKFLRCSDFSQGEKSNSLYAVHKMKKKIKIHSLRTGSKLLFHEKKKK